ncbi:MAG: helix-turn-helix domain-containing protein [Bacteroidaceae bacterium]|nr:helix-turn-helix domain-containing protein [Bacteroidaceae bacterium]
MKPKYCFILLITIVLLLQSLCAQTTQRLQLPNLEQLPSPRVLCVVQDEEGFLWYATEGGGVCCDDGRQMTVFRNDARHPDLLGSNNIASLAAAGRHIIIGSFHGAYVLDKSDYNIRRLNEVDDKRVDDVMVTKDGHWWITANKKVFEFSSDGHLLNTYPAGDKYVFRLHQDCNGRIWASQWQGGLLQLTNGRLQPAPWPLEVAPTNMADNPSGEGLFISTFGMGTVLYQPDQTTDSILTPASMPFHQAFSLGHERFDNNGRLLVADGMGDCFVLTTAPQQLWYQTPSLSPFLADSLRAARGLSQRPAAYTFDTTGRLWFSTGKDIRRQQQPLALEEVVLPDLADIAAMTFAADGTLWLGSIYGVIHTFKEGILSTDDYASNEYGDAILALQTDSLLRMLLVFEHYVRLYDPQQHTLRQQSREAPGTYVIELAETRPYQRWSQPESNMVVERLPRWLTAWWMCLIYLIIVASLLALMIHYYILRKQRRRFLESIREGVREEPLSPQTSDPSTQDEATPPLSTEEQWLQKAIALVMNHIDKDEYGLEQLCNDLAMSRMTFYRKIQSATGQKPSEFIRTIRLRRAAELLREGRLSVTEVSYDTGFSSVSYFSRCFRTMYGVPPTQFGKTTTADDRRPKDIPN